MIQLSSHTVTVVHADMTTHTFDADELQNRIIRACVAAGEINTWIAGDIARAVEFALISDRRRAIRNDELDSMVMRVLENAGYKHVAPEYKIISGAASPDMMEITRDNVSRTISANIALDDDRLFTISGLVENALRSIGFPAAAPRLIVELARQFRDSDSAHIVKPAQQNAAASPAEDAFLLQSGKLVSALPEKYTSLVNANAIRIHGISRLFPSLNMDISLAAFAELNSLARPVTELAFWAVSSPLAEALNAIPLAAAELCGVGKLPVFLTVRDGTAFAINYMNCPSKEAPKCADGLFDDIASRLVPPPFKTVIK